MEHSDAAATTVIQAWMHAIGAASEMVEAVLERYREPHRRYHTVEHVAAVLAAIEQLAADEEPSDVDAIVVAAIYHDAIYNSRADDNEAASAELARRDLVTVQWPEPRIESVVSMIRGTAHHSDASDSHHALLFDADLSILGAAPTSYDHYVHAVRVEYAHVDEQQWVEGRSNVLRALLSRSSLFHTESGRTRWHRAATSNLNRELKALLQS